jgi:thiol-disulfide isomerase/thioredoxin
MPKTRKNRIPKTPEYKTRPKVILIGKIYAKWCGHCKMLKPEWRKMKDSIRAKMRDQPNILVRFIEIEQVQEQQKVDKINRVYLANSNEKLSLQGGYPTLFKIENGTLTYFDGNRRADDMEKWYTGGEGNSGEESMRHNEYAEAPEKEYVTGENNAAQKQNSWFNIFGGKRTRKNKTKSFWDLF